MIVVLNVLYDERVGGPQFRVLQLAKRLRNFGFETHVVIPEGDPRFADLLAESEIPCHQLNLVRLRDTFSPRPHVRYGALFWPNVIALRQLIRQYHVEIVHTNGLRHVQAAVAARLERVKLVWHLNDVVTPWLLRLGLMPLVRSWSDAVAIASQAVGRRCLISRHGLEDRSWLLYAPVDTEKFHPGVDGGNVRREFGIPAGSPVIGMVANVCPGKGQEHFLEAASQIKRRYPDAKFLVVGSKLANREEFWSAVIQQIKRLGLTADAFLTGRRNDVAQLLRAMTVCVQASESEACPMAVLEAAASGVPVVATNVGGTPELIEDGISGILVDPRNASQIAKAVLRLLDAPEMARRIGMAGAERMRALFSLDRCVDEHIRLYTALLPSKGLPEVRSELSSPIAPEQCVDVHTRN